MIEGLTETDSDVGDDGSEAMQRALYAHSSAMTDALALLPEAVTEDGEVNDIVHILNRLPHASVREHAVVFEAVQRALSDRLGEAEH